MPAQQLYCAVIVSLRRDGKIFQIFQYVFQKRGRNFMKENLCQFFYLILIPLSPPRSFSLADFETNYQLPEFSEEIRATC